MERYLPALNRYLPQSDMTPPARIAAFLGKISVETGDFAKISEDTYYKRPDKLLTNWAGLFPIEDSTTGYLRDSEKLANYVYANKEGNGGPDTGDGWNYRGGGLLQITRKDTYRTIGQELGLDLVNHPELVRTEPEVAVLTALQYWKDYKLNTYADVQDYLKLTHAINKGNLEHKSRLAITQQALNVLNNKVGQK